jgi:beta-glucosidase
VEGGTGANTWSAWELATRSDGRSTIHTGERCGRATNQWEMFGTDLALMRWLGVDMYRFSIEWSRVEPLPGHIDDTALERYRSWCIDLVEAGISPMVTLHHFTEPAWTTDRGGFAHRSTVHDWLQFVRRCRDRLGDLVGHWVTVNEPVAYVAQGWLRGEWPPGRRDPREAAAVLENLMLAHAAAYRLLHEADRPERRHQVGLAHNIMPLRARHPLNPWNATVTRMLDRTYNRAVPEALHTGLLRLRLPGVGVTARHPALRGTQDFFGLNHYHAALVETGRSAEGPVNLVPTPGEQNDLGWTLDPPTIGAVLRWTRRYGLPVIITEHGTVDGDTPDLRRRRFLGACLAEIADAARDGVDVRGYLHWTLTDNFEWTHGFSARCGLFRVDRRDFHRSATSTAGYYRDIISAQAAGRTGRPDPTARSGS